MPKAKRRAGFWSEDNPPQPRDKPWKGKKQFCAELTALEESQLPSKPYKGFSNCVLCKRRSGLHTYNSGGWEWHSSLLHYVQEHNVKPLQTFIDFVMNGGVRPGMPDENCDKRLLCVEATDSRVIATKDRAYLVLAGMRGEVLGLSKDKNGGYNAIVRWAFVVSEDGDRVANHVADEAIAFLRYIGLDPIRLYRPCYDPLTDSKVLPDDDIPF